MKFSFGHITTGVLFAMLWASASAIGKIGLQAVEPLVLFTARFLVAGVILLIWAHVVLRDRFPQRNEWKQLIIFGLLNTTLYLGIFVLALQSVAAGISSIATALNPLLISVMSAAVMKRRATWAEWIGIVIGMAGVTVATYPLVRTSYATVGGVLLMVLSMVMYSAAAVYYAQVPWKLSRPTVNAWQVFLGAIMLLPFTFAMHERENHFDQRFWIALAWLVVPVSIMAIQLWLRLLKHDPVRASLWLFLCPVFGLTYATFLLNEPFTLYTIIGTGLVMISLYLGQRKAPTN